MTSTGRLVDKIVALLRERPDGMSDAEIAAQLGVLHQQVNSRCRHLAGTGVVKRDESARPILNHLVKSSVAVTGSTALPLRPRITADREWHWEGNVQASLARWLANEGWSLRRIADTAIKEKGTDIEAERDGVRLHVEVKGFPSKSYSDPSRAADTKPTQPSVQASHWYAGALLKVLQLRQSYPDDLVAMGLPDFPRYRNLLAGTQSTLRTMQIQTFLVNENGAVIEW
jgi:hypothetical protein